MPRAGAGAPASAAGSAVRFLWVAGVLRPRPRRWHRRGVPDGTARRLVRRRTRRRWSAPVPGSRLPAPDTTGRGPARPRRADPRGCVRRALRPALRDPDLAARAGRRRPARPATRLDDGDGPSTPASTTEAADRRRGAPALGPAAPSRPAWSRTGAAADRPGRRRRPVPRDQQPDRGAGPPRRRACRRWPALTARRAAAPR